MQATMPSKHLFGGICSTSFSHATLPYLTHLLASFQVVWIKSERPRTAHNIAEQNEMDVYILAKVL